MSDNWVVQNLENALETWNEKLAEIWQLITTTPQDFKGGGIWGVIVNINGAVQSIGLALLVLFFVAGMVKTCGSFTEVKKPEHALKLFVRFAIAKGAITYGMELMSNGSMFAHLEKFKSKDFWSEHRMITFNTLTDRQEYEIVAVFRTVVYTDSPEAFKFYRFIDAESANKFDDFIAKSKELSFYDTGVTAEYGDKLITLSTCEYSRNNSRLVVVAKHITEDGGADAAKTHAEATAEGERPN